VPRSEVKKENEEEGERRGVLEGGWVRWDLLSGVKRVIFHSKGS
jgi:hypothetical protein